MARVGPPIDFDRAAYLPMTLPRLDEEDAHPAANSAASSPEHAPEPAPLPGGGACGPWRPAALAAAGLLLVALVAAVGSLLASATRASPRLAMEQQEPRLSVEHASPKIFRTAALCSPPDCEEAAWPVVGRREDEAGAVTVTTTALSCCSAESAECLACQVDKPVAELCLEREHTSLKGCEGFCGLNEDNYQYPGGDLYSLQLSTAQACCAACRAEPLCSSWTWGKRLGSKHADVCFLKRQHVLRRLPDNDFISGLPDKEGPSVHIRLANRLQGDLCITADQSTGGRIAIAACARRAAGDRGQHWAFDASTGQLRALPPSSPGGGRSNGGETAAGDGAGEEEELCLDADSANRTGSGLRLQRCSISAVSQRWVFDSESGHVENPFGLCWGPEGGSRALRRTDGDAARRTPVRLVECRSNSVAQRWTFLAADSAEGLPVPTATTSTTVTTSSLPPTTTPRPRPSLLCWALMLPWGYEPTLMKMQIAERRSIFACEDFAVYSSEAVHLGSGYTTEKVEQDLHCPLGGEFHTALNTPIFLEIWSRVIKDGRFRHHSWTVKVDPDAVFLPSRLRDVVENRALEELARVGSGVFLNNCKYGLHGPIEVISRRALEVFADKRSICKSPPQEDVYLQSCLLKLGVTQMNQWNLLAEAACKTPNWDSCHSAHASFHPFKDLNEWRQCQEKAEADGVWEKGDLKVEPDDVDSDGDVTAAVRL